MISPDNLKFKLSFNCPPDSLNFKVRSHFSISGPESIYKNILSVTIPRALRIISVCRQFFYQISRSNQKATREPFA